MSQIPVCLIVQNYLMREGLKSILADTDFRVTCLLADVQDFKNCDAAPPPQLFIIDMKPQENRMDSNLEDAQKEQVAHIRSIMPDAKIICLIAREQSRRIPDLLLNRADGCIFRDTLKDAFLHYLNLVMMGERIVPACLPNFTPAVSTAFSLLSLRQQQQSKYELSQRERDIVRCLISGEPNKCIARRLGISEATVKVHLKTILRKLGVTNRTQAAMWAVNHGMDTNEAEGRTGDAYGH